MSEKCWNCGTTPNIRCCEFGMDTEPLPQKSGFMLHILRDHKDLKYVTQKSKNFGLLGGILLVEMLVHTSGDPTGYTNSSIVYPPC